MGNDEVIAALKEILAKLHVVADEVTTETVGGHTLLTIHTKESGVLIGAGGETLHALNYILRKAFERSDEGKTAQFIVDVNGYHLRHIQSLEGQAKMLAERARTFKYDVEMSPMSPYDRRIVHATLQNAPDVSTESRGEGVSRHIVIRYTPATAPTTEPA